MPDSDVIAASSEMSRDTPRPNRASTKAILRKIHLWVGLAMALPAIALGLSGLLLMFEPSGGTAAVASTVKLAPIVEAARQASGGAAGDVTIRPPERADGPIEVRIGQGPGTKSLAVDQITLTATPITATTWRFIHQLHGNFLSGQTGRAVVGWSGAAFFLLTVSGVILWWPSSGRWGVALTPRLRGSAYVVLRSIHPIAGAVLGIVIAVVSVTGFDLGVLPGGGPQREQSGRQPPAGNVFTVQKTSALDADAILVAAQGEAGNAPWRMIVVPRNPGRPARVVFAGSNGLVTVQVDATDGQIIPAAPQTAAPAFSLPLLIRQLHTGQNWGQVWWFLVMVSGVAMAGLSASGVASWWLRQIRSSRKRAR